MRPLVTRLQQQAVECGRMGSPLYEALLAGAAEDYAAGGPTFAVLSDQESQPPGSVPSLRLTGALHRMVLERLAPDLAMHYPSVGGTAGINGAWSAARELIGAEPDAIKSRVALPVQTNEVARAAALLVGVIHAVRRSGMSKVRLLEVGASAGLTMRFDRFRFQDARSSYGPEDSPVVLTNPWAGQPPDLATEWELVERRGCDPSPIDPLSTEGRLTLTSYVWADQIHRLERLRGALQLAASTPAVVDRASASDWLRDRLAEPCDALTVVWHSVVMQYMTPDERARVDSVLTEARLPAPLWRLAYEPVRLGSDYRFQLMATDCSRGPAAAEVLAQGEGHGPPVTLLAAAR